MMPLAPITSWRFDSSVIYCGYRPFREKETPTVDRESRLFSRHMAIKPDTTREGVPEHQGGSLGWAR